MNLEVRHIWSPDLKPPSDGLPADTAHFSVFAQVAIGAIGQPGHEVFSLTICSPSALAEATSDTFLTHTLVLDRFDWSRVRSPIDKLLLQCGGCRDWARVVQNLSGFLRYNGAA